MKENNHPKGNCFFFFSDKKIENHQPSLTGLGIKELIKGYIADFDMNQELVLEGRGHEEDLIVPNEMSVDLCHGDGEGPKTFFSRPAADFGA